MPEPARRRRPAGILIALCSALLGAAILWHAQVPDLLGLALPFEAVLPWLGVPIALLLLAALFRRAWFGILMSLAAVAAWSIVFTPRVLPLEPVSGSGAAAITVLSQNLHGVDGSPEKSARAAIGQQADIVAFEEVDAAARGTVDEVLGGAYPHAVRVGTVSLWSRFPLSNLEPLDLGLGWKRALRVTAETPSGPVRVYAVHAASARIGAHEERDRMLDELRQEIQQDGASRIIAMGDFNAGTDDRAFAPLLELLREPRDSSWGFGFTWPAEFPFVRLDHVLERGFDPRAMRTVELGDSDHLAVVATLRPSV
ncbi:MULTISPECIES: endonuclease/exonuclease/phosphatase family protein [unclassified Leucobacter]|uniref:endonuclease/exonuclease/phosphatase family protein n=1 Tax=unclassified Leucobacter TaxID=2621730 RepID=UPI00069B1AC2|nr:endonuclease/exonuclease/phosphatase family protein [Leucobacter sp. Ag1]